VCIWVISEKNRADGSGVRRKACFYVVLVVEDEGFLGKRSMRYVGQVIVLWLSVDVSNASADNGNVYSFTG